MSSKTLYSLLGIDPNADQRQLDTALERQLQRYQLGDAEALDDELVQIAAERRAELERAHHLLSDPQRRYQYDVSIGLITPAQRPTPERGLSARERLFAIGGAGLAILLIATIWLLTGRESDNDARAMGEVNRPAPAIQLATLDGGALDLSAYRGQVVLLNFWGTWCEPCIRELPALQQAHTDFGDQGLAVIGINLTDDEYFNGDDLGTISAFLEPFGVSYPIGLDVEGKVTNAYRVFPLPTSFFIDGEGTIRYVHVGELTLQDVEARFRQLQATGSSEPLAQP